VGFAPVVVESEQRHIVAMKTRLSILLVTMALAGCSTYQGGTGSGYDTGYGSDASQPQPTDFGRGGNRANPPPFDTESGAIMPETDGDVDLHGMQSGKFPQPSH